MILFLSFYSILQKSEIVDVEVCARSFKKCVKLNNHVLSCDGISKRVGVCARWLKEQNQGVWCLIYEFVEVFVVVQREGVWWDKERLKWFLIGEGFKVGYNFSRIKDHNFEANVSFLKIKFAVNGGFQDKDQANFLLSRWDFLQFWWAFWVRGSLFKRLVAF